MSILSEIFSWWGGNTWSNRIYTALRGKLVGTDAAGNRYYIQSKGIGPLGVPRRWVIYSNGAEASQVTPDWHGWMHYTVDTPPTEQDYQPRPWQKPHQMNMTGTAQAYRPRGSILATRPRPQGHRDLQSRGAPAERSASLGVTLTPCSVAKTLWLQGAIRDSNGTFAMRHTADWQCLAPAVPRLLAMLGLGCALLGLGSAPASAQRHRKTRSPSSRARQGDGQDFQTGKYRSTRRPSSAPLKITPRACYTRAPTEPPKTPPSWRSTR
jgi:NADH:ubiquinone oxidoreductase subunit